MSRYPPRDGGKGTARRIEKAIELIERELQRAIAYVNDAVIPEVRKESITAMRRVAETLQKLADRMEQPRQGPPNSNSSSSSEGPQP